MSFGGVEVMMNASCSECWDLGPPPDTILTMPPPPLPAFLQMSPPPPHLNNHLPANASSPSATPSPCTLPCDWSTAQGVQFIEMPRQGSTTVDDTWLLVLISCSVGVLLLGSLLALLLLKCREDRGAKAPLETDSKQRCEAVLYPSLSCGGGGGAGAGAGGGAGAPGAALWATLTPRGGTTHHLLGGGGGASTLGPAHRLFENSAFMEPEDWCLRPRALVSSPTRIENPNLPPLNLHRGGLRRPPLPPDHNPVL